jgi:hypothetical protein
MESNLYDVEKILENIRQNSVTLYKEHRSQYLELKGTLKYYKVPIIIISSISSIISMSQQFLDQNVITLLNMLLGLSCSIIGSIELFFGIASQMVLEHDLSKEYHIIAMDIYKYLQTDQSHRVMDGKSFLEQSYANYIKLIEKSPAVKKRAEDKLCPVMEGELTLSPSAQPSEVNYEMEKNTRKNSVGLVSLGMLRSEAEVDDLIP